MLPLHISLASHARVTIAVTKDVIGGVSLQAPIPDVPACLHHMRSFTKTSKLKFSSCRSGSKLKASLALLLVQHSTTQLTVVPAQVLLAGGMSLRALTSWNLDDLVLGWLYAG
jgi:hypothetical protein